MNCKKKLIKIFKQVWFYKSETKKIEPNRKTEPKPEKTEPNRFEPVFSQNNRTELKSVGWNCFFLKKPVWLFFFIKIEPNKK